MTTFIANTANFTETIPMTTSQESIARKIFIRSLRFRQNSVIKRQQEQHLFTLRKKIENLTYDREKIRLSQQQIYDNVIKPILIGKKCSQNFEHRTLVIDLARKSSNFISRNLTILNNLADKVGYINNKENELNQELKLQQNQILLSSKRSEHLQSSIKQSQQLLYKKREIVEEKNQANFHNLNFYTFLKSENPAISRDMIFIVQKLNELTQKASKLLQTVSLRYTLPSGKEVIITLGMPFSGGVSLILRSSSKSLKNSSDTIVQRFAAVCRHHSLKMVSFKVVEDQ